MMRALPYMLAAGLLMASIGTAYKAGESAAGARWQSRWDRQSAELKHARAVAAEQLRIEEQRRHDAVEGIRNDAQRKIEQAQADAASAVAAADSMRQQAKRLAARTGQCSSSASATHGSETAGSPGMVLADVLARADEAAGELAAAYDRARVAGVACEQAYQALRAGDRQSQSSGAAR